MKRNYLLLGIGLLIVAGAGVVGYLTLSAKPEAVGTVEEEKQGEMPAAKVSAVVDFGDGETFEYQKDFEEGKTAFSILMEMAEENQMEIETKEYDFGTLVEAIGGKENSTEQAWIYFINGESGQVAADKQELKTGDKVEWKFIKPEY